MTRLRNSLLAVGAMLLLTASPAAAITYGTPDGNDHPYVAFMLLYDATEDDFFSCSGTLLAPTVFLTAGHCAVNIGSDGQDVGRSGGTDVWISFDSGASGDIFATFPQAPDYPDHDSLNAARRAWVLARPDFIRGVAHPDPAFDDFASYPVTNDLGIVTLSSPVTDHGFGAIAPVGTAERLLANAKNKNAALIETVGYGTQAIQPHPLDVVIRYRSTSRIVELNGNASKGGNLHTLNNPSAVGGRGGSCFGDSGGPLLVPGTNQVVAVVSFGFSGTCHGADYSWRVDTVPSQAFIASWLD